MNNAIVLKQANFLQPVLRKFTHYYNQFSPAFVEKVSILNSDTVDERH